LIKQLGTRITWNYIEARERQSIANSYQQLDCGCIKLKELFQKKNIHLNDIQASQRVYFPEFLKLS
jgi:hypothetical protein